MWSGKFSHSRFNIQNTSKYIQKNHRKMVVRESHQIKNIYLESVISSLECACYLKLVNLTSEVWMTSLLMVMVTGVPVSWLVQCVRLSLLSDPGLQDLEKIKSWELLKVHYSHLVDHLWPFCHVIGSIQTQRRMKFNVFYLNFSFTVRLEITGTDDRNQPFLVSWDECQSWQCLVSVRSTLTALPLARGKRFWRSARRTTGVNGSTLIRASTEKRMKNDRWQCSVNMLPSSSSDLTVRNVSLLSRSDASRGWNTGAEGLSFCWGKKGLATGLRLVAAARKSLLVGWGGWKVVWSSLVLR